jgi:hypothetical protein
VTSQVWVNHVISNAHQPLPLFTQQPTFFCIALSGEKGQKATKCTAAKFALFDDLVGDCEHARRNGEAERFGRRKIDSKLEFGWLLDRDIARLRPA